jgi:FHS family L-fucose permease-like MFS transporter
VVKCRQNINAFWFSGLLMMLIGLICTDTEIAKFFIMLADYFYLLCGLLFLILAIAGLGKKLEHLLS